MDLQILLDCSEKPFRLLSVFVGIRNRPGREAEIAEFADWLDFKFLRPFFPFFAPFSCRLW
jgi:hypothetical protein